MKNQSTTGVRSDETKNSDRVNARLPAGLSLAEGLQLFFTRGALVQPVKMTKRRAVIMLNMLKHFEENFEMDFRVEDDEMYHDYQMAIQWVFNEINKRYSQADLGK